MRRAHIRVVGWLLLSGVAVSASQSPGGRQLAHPSAACAASLDQCLPEGCGNGDRLLNKKKNRTDPVKTAVQLFTFGDFLTLEAERPQTWQQNQARGVVEKLGEDTPVSLVGFLIDLHPGLPETCNCKLPGEDNNDFHLNIVARVGDGLRDSVVLEMTPKVRKNVAEWTRANLLTRLNPNPNQPPMVRISGYLLFDSEHVSRSGGARATIWEIHPVTKLEFCQSGSCASSSTAGWQTMGELQ